MRSTRKKVIKTVYKDEDDSAEEAGDFSDSGSEAVMSEQESSSEDEAENEEVASSGDEFVKNKNKSSKPRPPPKPKKFSKTFINKISKQSSGENEEISVPIFSVKDLTESDKLLPSILNLSESDSSDDESPKQSTSKNTSISMLAQDELNADEEAKTEYKDVWSQNIQDDSVEVARKAFLELEKHKTKIEETKASLHNYTSKQQTDSSNFDVQDLLAQGEEVTPQKSTPVKKKTKGKKVKDESDSDIDDWEEVQESKAIPQQGLQLVVELPNSVCRKAKKLDVEMMMKRKINRVKKEYQVYMHKVHILCWLGHGNYVSRVLNDQQVLAATLSLVPSKECYPGERVDMKYLEQITTWYKDKLTLKQDKNENKYRPKAPPLKEILLSQIKSKVVTSRKYTVFIFVAMLRALGLQCRIMFNFVTLPIKPPSSELCSLSTKPKEEGDKKSKSPAKVEEKKKVTSQSQKKSSTKSKTQVKISQVDGNDDSFLNIMQIDGNDDTLPTQTRSTRARKAKTVTKNATEDDVSPPKRSRRIPSPKHSVTVSKTKSKQDTTESKGSLQEPKLIKNNTSSISTRNTRNTKKSTLDDAKVQSDKNIKERPSKVPKIEVTKPEQESDKSNKEQSSKYFSKEKEPVDNNKTRQSRKRALTANPDSSEKAKEKNVQKPTQIRTKSAPGDASEKSKYFDSDTDSKSGQNKKTRLSLKSTKSSDNKKEDQQRVSHKDLAKQRAKPKSDVKSDLVKIIKGRVREAKEESKKGKVKGKLKPESDEDSDFLPEEDTVHGKSDSDDEFKPASIISPRPKASTSKKIDRRVVSSTDSETPTNKIDVWCEVFVEELEQWIAVNVIKGTVHCAENLYTGATHPVCYVVGWDNNNYLKDLTRRYVPHWNTVTRKQRVEPSWWATAVRPWLGPSNARDKEENEQLDRMQLEAPLPKSIAEYKNHPLYALKRHLLKFEAIYPPDAATLGFVRGEPVYARDCVYTCRSRDTWLKEAKVVRLGQDPYKVVKARPKWDKLSNKLITDKPLEVFGPWQVQDYEPPTAENGVVPRNAYGNVELFKACMLPKGTVHIKLPGLNKIARKLNIDCAPAMTGFDFNGGWSHPVYDGFVVCKEFEQIITEAWLEDQEDQERKEQEKTEARVYGNWRRLIKGLLIRERLKLKYGFQEPTTSKDNKKNAKGPRLVVKKK